MTQITVSVPGKIILMGEHAVVYGKPGLLATVDKRLTVSIETLTSDEIILHSKNLNLKRKTTVKKMTELTQRARSTWQLFSKNNDIRLLKSLFSDELDFMAVAVIETFAFHQKQLSSGFAITIDSQIPIGSGLGSSAATAAGIAGAITALLPIPFNPATVDSIAYLCEQYRHGFPSGADTAAVSFGGLLWYRKETAFFKTFSPVSLAIPEGILNNLLLINSGKPEESTGEMVSEVRTLFANNDGLKQTFLTNQETVTRGLLESFDQNDADTFKSLIKQGERNLESIGVVSKKTQLLIRDIEKADGAAKICGAGGKKTNSGVILAYTNNKQQLEELLQKLALDYFPIKLGGEGLRKEALN